MATKTIAAHNSPAEKKALADYICDGTGDHSEIIQAINASQSGDTVLLYEGTYNLAGSIFPKGGTTFKGEGVALTKLNLVGSSHIFIDYENVTVEDFFFSHTDSPDGDKWLGGFVVRASYAKINRVNGWADQKTAAVFHTLSSFQTPTAPLQYVEYQDCVVDGAYTYPFLHNWWDGDTAKKTHKNIKYIRCKALNCGNVAQPQQPYSIPAGTGPYRFNEWVCGFDFAETNDIDSLYVKECESSGNWESGFHMEWDPNKVNCVFEDCIAKNNGKKPNYPNETANPFYGFKTNTGEFFGSGFYLPNFKGRLERCYTEANSRCGFWVTNGGVLTDCVDKDCGIGRTPNQYLQPMSFMGNPCRTPFEGWSLKLIRCKSINSRCYAFWYDYAAHIYMEDCEVYGGQGYNGVLNHFGSQVSNYFYDSDIGFARIECPANLTAINAHQNIRVNYGPGVLVSDAAKPFTITGNATNSILVHDWTTVSQTLTPGPGGVFIEDGASSAQVTQDNVVITDTDPGVPPVDPPEEGDWLTGWRYRHPLLIKKEKISSSETDLPIAIFLNAETGLDDVLTALGSNALKIAVADVSGEEMPVEIVRWDTVGLLYVRVPLLHQGTDTLLYLYYDPDHADNTAYVDFTTGAAAEDVWENKFLAAWNGVKNPEAERMYDSTSNWKDAYLHNDYGGSYTVEFDSEGRKGIKFSDGGYADTLISPAEINSADAFSIEATVKLHSLNTGVWNNQMWFGQNSPLSARVYAAVYGMPPKWAFAIGDQPWSDNSSPACTEDLTHIMWTVNKATQVAKLYVNGVLVETKSGWTWISLDKNLFEGWAVAWEGTESLGYAANIIFYNLRAALTERSANWVNIQAQSERNLLLTYYAAEEAPVGPPPAPWADSRYRYRREFTISGAAATETVPQVLLRFPLLRSVPSGTDMANYPIVDRMIPSMNEFKNFYNSWCITDADGNFKYARWVVYPTTGTVFNMPCLTWEAYFAPKIEPGVQNRFYLYYTPEYARNNYTGGDVIAWPPGTTDYWDDSGPDYYTLIDQHFAYLLYYSDDRYNYLSDNIPASEMPTQTFTMGLDVLGGHAPPYRVCDPVLGNGLRVGQAYSYPFTLGQTYKIASGERDVNDPDIVAEEQERLRTKWHDVTGALTVEIVLKLNELPVPPEGEWKYIVPISKGWAADSGGSWTLAIRDTGEGYFMVRKPDNSGWINNVDAFGPIPLNERVYIACVFAPNDHITVYTYCPSQGFRKTSSSAAGVSGSYRSEHMGGINVPYAHDYMNGVVYMASISKVARSESWIKMRALAYTDSIMDIFTLGEEEERVGGVTAEITATAHTTRIVAEALTPETTGIREVVARIRRLVAVATAHERAETVVVTGKVKRVIAVAYADREGVSGAMSHVRPVTAFTEMTA